jgi:DNA replication protein DnaC
MATDQEKPLTGAFKKVVDSIRAEAGTPSSESATPDILKCSVCYDVGWVKGNAPFGSPEFGRFQPCTDCNYHTNSRAKWIRGLSRLDPNKTFETWKPVDDGGAYEAALEWAEEKQQANILMLVGGFGSGKTHLMHAIFNRLADQGSVSRMVDVPELRQKLMTGIDTNETGLLLETYSYHGILGLDEMGAGRDTPTPTMVEWMELIINARYEKGGLVIATNMTDEDTERMWGPRIYERLWDTETGQVQHVIIQAKSFRTGRGY